MIKIAVMMTDIDIYDWDISSLNLNINDGKESGRSSY